MPSETPNPDDTTILDAFALLDENGEAASWVVWCPWCEAIHRHSPADGHVCAHCFNKSSPFHGVGYTLRCVGTVTDEEALEPDALGWKFQAPFDCALAEERESFRSLLLSAMFGLAPRKAKQFSFSHDLGRTKLIIIGNRWVIEKSSDDKIGGVGLLKLAQRLYNLPLGVIIVRLLDEMLGCGLDPGAALAVQAAIEAWVRRGMPSREWRS